MIIKKLEGKILLELEEKDFIKGKVDENIYFKDMLFNDLGFEDDFYEDVNGSFYLFDYRTKKIYELDKNPIKELPLDFLIKKLEEKKKIYLYEVCFKK